MNQAFDYNGKVVAKSTPAPQLRTVKKVVHIDSADRDSTKYYTNGDFVVYLPRVYENVVSIRLMAGEFPPIVFQTTSPTTPCAFTHSYANSSNYQTGYVNTDDKRIGTDIINQFYFLIDIEGLNKTDECALAGNRSTYPDGFFAKIPVLENSYGSQNFIEYNDHSGQENIARYTPVIGKLDRLHIRTRLHSQQGNQGFIYWTSDSTAANGTNQKGAEFSISLEIEYLDNVFDEFSSFETRLRDRS